MPPARCHSRSAPAGAPTAHSPPPARRPVRSPACEQVAWALVGSHNLSMAAWGSMVEGSKLWIKSYGAPQQACLAGLSLQHAQQQACPSCWLTTGPPAARAAAAGPRSCASAHPPAASAALLTPQPLRQSWERCCCRDSKQHTAAARSAASPARLPRARRRRAPTQVRAPAGMVSQGAGA